MADVVARLDALAGQFAYTGHGYTYFVCMFHHWLATGKTVVAIQLAMIGKLRFYSQTGLNSQAAREQMKGNSGVFNRHPLFYCHKSAYMIAP
ncbi:UNVERIFIED_ORG: hypothetical protein J2S29_003510 [Rhizobium sp. SLBN-170]